MSGLGINCRGSGLCDSGGGAATDLVAAMKNINPSQWYNDGDHIACRGTSGRAGICAFLQNSGGENGSTIQSLAPYITDHGCSNCGSVPLLYPSENNVANGELTFNDVSDAGVVRYVFLFCG